MVQVSSPKDNTKLIIPQGCNNAPRKQVVIDFTVGIIMKQIEVIKEYADESIVWYQLNEGKKVQGLCSMRTNLQEEENKAVNSVEIGQVITHGKLASINGVISLDNDIEVQFCDVYTFSSAARSGKVKEIKSYRIESLCKRF